MQIQHAPADAGLQIVNREAPVSAPALRHSALEDIAVDDLGIMANILDTQRELHDKTAETSKHWSGVYGTLTGIVLLEARRRLAPHGMYLAFLAQHLGKSRVTAAKYVAVAKAYLASKPAGLEQLSLPLMSGDRSLSLLNLDTSHPVVEAVTKWTNGRSFNRLRLEEVTQGGNHHPKCPHCKGALKSKTQPHCPHCGKPTSQEEKSPEEVRAELVKGTRTWMLDQLDDDHVTRKMYRLLPDSDLAALLNHHRSQAKAISDWLEMPQRRREEMAIEEVLG